MSIVRETLSLDIILLGFEQTLQIDHNYSTAQDVINSAITRLESQSQIKFGGHLADERMSSPIIADRVTKLIAQINELLKSLALLFAVTLSDKAYGETLASLNYLGYSQQALVQNLKYLCDVDTYSYRQELVDTLTDRLTKVPISSIKRLLLIMLIFEKIGHQEAVSIIAQYLYIGARKGA